MRFNQGFDDIPERSGPSKKQMEEDLRRAVLNTGGKAIDGKAAPAAVATKPVGELRAIKPIPPPAAKVEPQAGGIRYVEAVEFKGKLAPIRSAAPKLRMADPTVLRVEPSYQRDLSPKSHRLIQSIIAGWDWAKFKPPVCAQTAGGLFVIDGQHTAIAAASHPLIKEIPILIVEAAEVERRAEAFVSHNRDRLVMTQAQIFHGEIAAGERAPAEILAAVQRAGGSIPRSPISSFDAKPGQITSIGEIRNIYGSSGVDVVERIVRIAVMSKIAPAGIPVLRSIRSILTDPANASLAKMSDTKISGALASIDNFVIAAATRAAGTGKGRGWAGAQLLAERLRSPR
jgi:hypothetical protein